MSFGTFSAMIPMPLAECSLPTHIVCTL